ncbi:hypothetical protein RF11_10758 [Thelohanellus kitauei]|uniref:Transcription factor TFIIIB component B'' Myb domain-containing protein n=1 Tax=Thelohanellus kitauei TaxID=669202 RepID=A0A0C2MTK2_THEKT|nr:hypothetical protein RF11_10758 [Thelohanellus kitauei]
MEVVHYDNVSWIRYVKKKHRKCSWPIDETIRFYQALVAVGTDFTLMRHYLPNKYVLTWKKFKAEEKKNPDLVDDALKRNRNVSVDRFKNLPPRPPPESE